MKYFSYIFNYVTKTFSRKSVWTQIMTSLNIKAYTQFNEVTAVRHALWLNDVNEGKHESDLHLHKDNLLLQFNACK
jgi:hypothetical protein